MTAPIDVYDYLCDDDPEANAYNPDFPRSGKDADGDCFCDNCFHHNTGLAERILELEAIVEKLSRVKSREEESKDFWANSYWEQNKDILGE